jgi:hypothetical protein
MTQHVDFPAAMEYAEERGWFDKIDTLCGFPHPRNPRPNSIAGPLPSRFLVARVPLSDGSPKRTQAVDFTRIFDAHGAIFGHRK